MADFHSVSIHILNSVQFAVSLYNGLMAAGKPLGIKNAGYYAIDSLRVMRGYPRLGVELGPFTNPFQAGLDERIDINKVMQLYEWKLASKGCAGF